MKDFSKIINTDKYQLVVMLMSDEDNKDHVHIIMRDEEHGCTFEPKMGYDNEEDARAAFEKFDEEGAKHIINMFQEMVG